MIDTSNQKIENFFSVYQRAHIGKKQVLIHAHEEPEGIMYLQSGRVKQYDITSAGNEVVVNIFKPSAYFPMSWALSRRPNIYYYEAMTDVEVRIAPVHKVVEFLKADPDLLLDLLSRVYTGMDGVLRRSSHLMGSDARTRLLFEILTACKRYGEPQQDGALLVTMHETDLATSAGLSRETVSRQVCSLKEQGLLHVERCGMYVYDVEKLAQELGDRL